MCSGGADKLSIDREADRTATLRTLTGPLELCMKMMIAGMTGWARFENRDNAQVRGVDTMITVVGTMFLAVTYMLIRG
jgi:hypothetical protein